MSNGKVNHRFYGWKFRFTATCKRSLNAIGDHKADELPPQLTLFNTVIPIPMHFFSHFKGYYVASIASACSNVKPYTSQSEATFHNDVCFATVYCRIYCRKFLTLSNQTSHYIRRCIRISNIILRWSDKVLINDIIHMVMIK